MRTRVLQIDYEFTRYNVGGGNLASAGILFYTGPNVQQTGMLAGQQTFNVSTTYDVDLDAEFAAAYKNSSTKNFGADFPGYHLWQTNTTGRTYITHTWSGASSGSVESALVNPPDILRFLTAGGTSGSNDRRYIKIGVLADTSRLSGEWYSNVELTSFRVFNTPLIFPTFSYEDQYRLIESGGSGMRANVTGAFDAPSVIGACYAMVAFQPDQRTRVIVKAIDDEGNDLDGKKFYLVMGDLFIPPHRNGAIPVDADLAPFVLQGETPYDATHTANASAVMWSHELLTGSYVLPQAWPLGNSGGAAPNLTGVNVYSSLNHVRLLWKQDNVEPFEENEALPLWERVNGFAQPALPFRTLALFPSASNARNVKLGDLSFAGERSILLGSTWNVFLGAGQAFVEGNKLRVNPSFNAQPWFVNRLPAREWREPHRYVRVTIDSNNDTWCWFGFRDQAQGTVPRFYKFDLKEGEHSYIFDTLDPYYLGYPGFGNYAEYLDRIEDITDWTQDGFQGVGRFAGLWRQNEVLVSFVNATIEIKRIELVTDDPESVTFKALHPRTGPYVQYNPDGYARVLVDNKAWLLNDLDFPTSVPLDLKTKFHIDVLNANYVIPSPNPLRLTGATPVQLNARQIVEGLSVVDGSLERIPPGRIFGGAVSPLRWSFYTYGDRWMSPCAYMSAKHNVGTEPRIEFVTIWDTKAIGTPITKDGPVQAYSPGSPVQTMLGAGSFDVMVPGETGFAEGSVGDLFDFIKRQQRAYLKVSGHPASDIYGPIASEVEANLQGSYQYQEWYCRFIPKVVRTAKGLALLKTWGERYYMLARASESGTIEIVRGHPDTPLSYAGIVEIPGTEDAEDWHLWDEPSGIVSLIYRKEGSYFRLISGDDAATWRAQPHTGEALYEGVTLVRHLHSERTDTWWYFILGQDNVLRCEVRDMYSQLESSSTVATNIDEDTTFDIEKIDGGHWIECVYYQGGELKRAMSADEGATWREQPI
jgi:hypothetical protein